MDDHAFVRLGVRNFLEGTGEALVVGEADDGWAALRALLGERRAADVVLLDLSLTRLNGTEVLRRLRKGRPELPVVVLSMYRAEAFARRMIALGAVAYLAKDASPEQLLATVRAAAAGAAPAALASARPASPEPLHAALSPREYQVFTLIYQGRTATMIAGELNLSASTVSNHLAKVKEKLGVQTLAELIRYACDAGLLPAPKG